MSSPSSWQSVGLIHNSHDDLARGGKRSGNSSERELQEEGGGGNELARRGSLAAVPAPSSTTAKPDVGTGSRVVCVFCEYRRSFGERLVRGGRTFDRKKGRGKRKGSERGCNYGK